MVRPANGLMEDLNARTVGPHKEHIFLGDGIARSIYPKGEMMRLGGISTNPRDYRYEEEYEDMMVQ